MIKREDLVGKNQQEIQLMLESEIQKFIVEVSELNDEAEVIAKEEEIMATMNENDAHLKSVVYKIAEKCEFDGSVYNADTVCKQVAEMIENNEVEWSYTLGLYELSKLWRATPETIQYHAYDSTLRVLGGLKYKGRDQWRKILTINNFLGSCHDEYMRDTAYMLYLSNLHNVVIDALKKFRPDMMEDEAPAE
jgi:hypothetical protein